MLWELFHGKPKPKKTQNAIIDNNINEIVYIPAEYAQMGKREGWLVYLGYHEEYDGTLTYRWRHI